MTWQNMKRIAVCFAALSLPDAAWAAINPWFGTWSLRLDDAAQKPETLVYSDAGNGAMRMESIETGSVIVTRFDGQPAADLGSGSGKAVTLAIRATSPSSYSWTFAISGTPRARGINTLAADGKTFKEVSWSIAKPDKIITLIYERR